MGSSNETSFYGPVRNPWDTERVPGGSSGGSAAAVAARLAPVATGTDTGGSIRQPAALLRPDRAQAHLRPRLAPRHDRLRLEPGPGAARWPVAPRTARCCSTPWRARPAATPPASTAPVPDYCAGLDADLRGLRIGLPREYFGEGLDPGTERVVRAGLAELEAPGRDAARGISLPHAPLTIPAYYIIAPAEASTNLSRFDGVRYGYRCQDPARPARPVHAQPRRGLRRRSQAAHPGRHLRAVGRLLRRLLPQGAADPAPDRSRTSAPLLSEVDVIAGPASPSPAFRSARRARDPIAMYLEDIYTIAANLAGAAGACRCPAGLLDGLPVGMQLIGSHLQRSAPAERRAPLPAGHRLAPAPAGGHRLNTSRGMHMEWETVIGLEVHVQLATRTKIFSGSPDALRRRRPTRRPARSTWRCPARCRC